jgi:ABC-type phosphate/phosphonate transport system substrate-binding protein
MVILPVITMCVVPVLVSAEQADGMPRVFRSGFLQRVFYETDPRDAKAAIEVQAREVTRSMGLNTPPQVTLYPDMSAMANALRRGELELVTMPTVEYLRIREMLPLIPSFVAANNNGLGTRYVIITRTDSDLRTFNDLKGKSLLLPPVAKHELSHLWLDVLLMKAGKGDSSHFFRQVKESPKITNAVMGVFLRQADAAIVTRAGLDTSRQLNPQLETQLTILAESRDLSDGVTCLIPGTPEKFRTILHKEIIRLNNTSGGRQMYTIFQSSGVTVFKPEHLEGLEELLRERNRLLAKQKRKP